MLVLADSMRDDGGSASDAVLGDALCLAGAVAYGVSNVGQEYIVKRHDKVRVFVCATAVRERERELRV